VHRRDMSGARGGMVAGNFETDHWSSEDLS